MTAESPVLEMKKHSPFIREFVKEKEVVIAKDQVDYMPLPALISENGYRVTTSRYRLGLKERLRILWSGNLWVQIMTFSNPLQPIKLMTEEPPPEDCI